MQKQNPENEHKVSKSGFLIKSAMKIQPFSGIQREFQFSLIDDLELFKNRFYQSDLGKLYTAIPWKKLISDFGIREKKLGRCFNFPPQARLALMFLKNYSGLSDRKLIEQLNGNIEWQFFSGIYLGHNRIENYKIVSQIRSELSEKLDIDKLQKTLYDYWRPFIEEPEKITMDATCYESEVRYPTDVKLLWESVEWCHNRMQKVSRALGERQIRSKYIKWSKRYIGYSKMRRKTNKKKHALRRSSLLLIKKYMDFLFLHYTLLSERDRVMLDTIKKVYSQQYAWFHKGIKPKNRIISLHKAYLRPIVRGKETKSVEFGAKVNKIQIGGISFIERLSFNAFNEGTRFKSSVYFAQSLSHRKTRVAGADTIYATNANRRFASSENIKTDFKPKGPKRKDRKQQDKLKGLIRKERATRLEGSFGKDKEHYHLRKIKARTKANEKLWIFFGIHTSNAIEIGRKMLGQKQIAA